MVSISSASTALAIMLGLSCGIDYALFIASRHRANLMRGMSVEDSIALAVGTSGSSVVFAALTVIVALCGLTVVGIPFLSVMGLAAAGTVAIAMLIAITLLPALLGFARRRVTRFIRLPRRAQAGPRRARRRHRRPSRVEPRLDRRRRRAGSSSGTASRSSSSAWRSLA